MARRSGSDKRLKDDSVRLRVTPQERRLIEGKARQAGVTMSEFIRQAALNREVRSVADRKAMADLNRLGGLLKWWLTDGKGKDGDRHIRGKAPPEHVPTITDILHDLKRAVLRVITSTDDHMDEEDWGYAAEADAVEDGDDR
ncbi:plasmid mobilization protein [Azospirillum sp. B510]|uniref:plasmid mobilization protein n=1 Tax=Azospirillum sp. (strain B510) TaxID=137722 RepID=UPI0026AF84AF